MKKLLLSLAIVFGAINSGFATDLYVNSSGQSGTYTTIQAAINGASTGDNIYVSPLNSYQESLSITKSVRIASSVAGSRIIVTQSISISPVANIVVELIGIEGTSVILGTQTSTLGPNSRGKAIITDCSFHDISLDTDYLTLLVVKCSLSGTLTGRHGKFIGNTITERIIINDEPNIGIGDTVLVKANNVAGNIEINTDDHSVIVQNNKTARILISNWRSGVTINGLIANNSVINRESTRYSSNGVTYSLTIAESWGDIDIRIAASNQDVSNMKIINNYIDALNATNYSGYQASYKYNKHCAVGVSGNIPITYPIVQYNIFDRELASLTPFHSPYWPSASLGIYNIQTNIGVSDDAQIMSEGKDVGSPSPKFFDADLTRSDIGHFGGDNSWEMFHGEASVTGAAYIISLDLPSEIWPGQTINLKAEAVHTN